MTGPGTRAAPAFWRAYWITLRPYLFFVSGATGLVGMALVPRAAVGRLAVAFVALFLSYGFGQALTDVFQTDTDAISAPYRPLVRGEIGGRDVLWVSVGALSTCGAVLGLLSPWTLALSALAVAGLVAYTPLKRRWWGGPACNSGVVALLPALGFFAAGAPPHAAVETRRLLLAALSAFFSYAVFVMLGYLKDVEADRATGYRTIAVRFGRRRAVLASALSCAAAIVASILLLDELGTLARGGVAASAIGAALWAWGAFALVLAHLRAWTVWRDDEAHPAVALSVRGYVALHLGEAVLARPDLALAAAVLLPLFEVALALRPSRAQV